MRLRLLASALLLYATSPGGCTRSGVLPPPTASIPAPVPGTGLPAPLPAAPGALPPRPGANPWRPSVAARPWKYIVVHHTATESGNVESIHASHLKNKDGNGKPWLGIGYHFVIGNGSGMADGAVEPTFRWRTQIQGAHAGSSNKDYNELGIGICLVGNFEKRPPSPAQQRSARLLVQTLRAEYGIPATGVVAHKEIRASSTECPGKFFNMAALAAEGSPANFSLNDQGVPVEFVAFSSRGTMR